MAKYDPGVRFLPTSPFGPVFFTGNQWVGTGLQHNVHGPWNMSGSFGEWKKLWDHDDALFHGETGHPGAESIDLIMKYRGDYSLWPPSNENPYWRHVVGLWWNQWDKYQNEVNKQLFDNDDVVKYVQWSQETQSKALKYAVKRCKDKFPRCSGIILWMGHDCFPCTINTSLLDYLGRPKPAAKAVREIFTKNNYRGPNNA